MQDITRHIFSQRDVTLDQAVSKTHIDGMWYLPSSVYGDERGFFAQVAEWPPLNAMLDDPFVPKQYNHAHSEQGVIRGFHAEAWNKLVYVGRGVAFCALLDLRQSSPTFLTMDMMQLGYGNEALTGVLYIPEGVANSVCVVEGPIDYFYLVDKLYSDRTPEDDLAIDLFDEDIAVDWPTTCDTASLSKRDKEAVSLKTYLRMRVTV